MATSKWPPKSRATAARDDLFVLRSIESNVWLDLETKEPDDFGGVLRRRFESINPKRHNFENLARLCKVSGWIAMQKQLELQDVPENGSLISVDESTSDELATLGITKDRLGNGRRFDVVNIRRFDPREGPERRRARLPATDRRRLRCAPTARS